jgi:hypothetical protein
MRNRELKQIWDNFKATFVIVLVALLIAAVFFVAPVYLTLYLTGTLMYLLEVLVTGVLVSALATNLIIGMSR